MVIWFITSVISPLQQQWRQLRRREGEEKARSGEEKSPEWQQQWQRRSSRHLRSPQVRPLVYFLVILSRVHNLFLGILNAFSGVWVEVSFLHLTSCWKGLEVSLQGNRCLCNQKYTSVVKEIGLIGRSLKTPCNCARFLQKKPLVTKPGRQQGSHKFGRRRWWRTSAKRSQPFLGRKWRGRLVQN